ncbi:hypothetical protein B0H14DRAFT_3726468 [Mycena olivaceomarginata]|nr:hypothetical protein B0H14DRAFT_3726468 [Mycena olivaceomarginata]
MKSESPHAIRAPTTAAPAAAAAAAATATVARTGRERLVGLRRATRLRVSRRTSWASRAHAGDDGNAGASSDLSLRYQPSEQRYVRRRGTPTSNLLQSHHVRRPPPSTAPHSLARFGGTRPLLHSHPQPHPRALANTSQTADNAYTPAPSQSTTCSARWLLHAQGGRREEYGHEDDTYDRRPHPYPHRPRNPALNSLDDASAPAGSRKETPSGGEDDMSTSMSMTGTTGTHTCPPSAPFPPSAVDTLREEDDARDSDNPYPHRLPIDDRPFFKSAPSPSVSFPLDVCMRRCVLVLSNRRCVRLTPCEEDGQREGKQ